MNTLFGHLSLKFAAQPENLATEGLSFILSNSQAARSGFLKIISGINNNLNSPLTFQTQVYEADNAIPDLIGFDEKGNAICIVEAKFWAGLTDNQPLTYLKRLPKGTPSVLLFIAPQKRLDSLADEVFERMEKKYALADILRKPDLISAAAEKNQFIAITSWRAVLDIILRELDLAGDSVSKADLTQLQGLCDQMDSTAFLPVQSYELSPNIGRRNVQFGALIDEIVSKGVSEKLFSTDAGKLRNTSSSDYYGRYFKIGSIFCCLSFDNYYWAEYQNTPFWLEVIGNTFDNRQEKIRTKNALSSLELQIPRGLFVDPHYGYPLIPLQVELGVEKDRVIASMLSQIKSVVAMVPDK